MEFFATLGLAVVAFTVIILIYAWSDKIDDLYRRRKDAIEYGSEVDRILATRELFLWSVMPVAFPIVLLVLLAKWIWAQVRALVTVMGDLHLGQNLDKLQEEKPEESGIHDLMEK